MAQKTPIRKRKASPSASTLQLSFDFGGELVEAKPSYEIVPQEKIEALPPVSAEANTSIAATVTDGAEENRYLLHQSDKYEERALKTLVLFIVAAAATVLAKSGIPLPTAIPGKIGLPPISNVRLLCGISASATVLFAVALAYFALRMRQHSPQLRLKLIQRTWAGYIAQYLLAVCVLFICAILLAVLILAGPDLIYLMTYIVDRQLYVLDGWEPVQR